MRPPRTELTLTEWVILALICEGPTHGWAVARALRPEGSIGMVWSSRPPLVYRAANLLKDAGLVRDVGSAEGRGPSRSMLEATAAGHEAVAEWLAEPVAHIRDLRSELLVKLILRDRRGLDRRPLIDRQRPILEGYARRLEDRLSGPRDRTDQLVTLWRATAVRAALGFIALLEERERGTDRAGVEEPAREGSAAEAPAR